MPVGNSGTIETPKMIWPFTKKKSPPLFVFRDGSAMFPMQCKYGDTTIEPKKGLVALVSDAWKEFDLPTAVKIDADGSQTAVLRVASDDGGFVVIAKTPPGRGDPLQPGDLVMWVPMTYS